MNTNPPKRGGINKELADSGSATLLLIQKRARELAVNHGRPSQDATDLEWEQAWQELSLGRETNP